MASDPVLKEFAVNLDLKRTLPLEAFEIVHGDTGNRLVVTLTDGGTAVSLEDCFVTAVFQGSAGTAFQASDDGSITLSGNTAVIELLPTSAAPGEVSCELQIYTSADPQSATGREDYDVLVTTARFCFYCREAMLNDESFAATPESPMLIALLDDIGDAEAARQAAEAARQAAETARQTAETARQTAETARAAAETLREQEFAALIASAGLGSITGTGAPTAVSRAEPGQLYFDTQNLVVYVCVSKQNDLCTWRKLQYGESSADALTVQRSATYTFDQLPSGEPMTLQQFANRMAGWYDEIASKQTALIFDVTPASGSVNPVTSGGVYSVLHAAEWQTIADRTLQSAASIINIAEYGEGYGTGAFAFDELRFIMIGCLTGGAAVRLYVNSNTETYIAFNSFTANSPDAPENCAVVLQLSKPAFGLIEAERIYGGDYSEEGYSMSSNVHRALLLQSGVRNYSAIRLTGNAAGIKFAAGSRVILQGRNII